MAKWPAILGLVALPACGPTSSSTPRDGRAPAREAGADTSLREAAREAPSPDAPTCKPTVCPGASWTPVGTMVGPYYGAWGSASNDVWAVGLGGVTRWDGSTWKTVTVPGSEPLAGIWGSAADDVWLVGGKGTLLHWNGAAFASAASGTTNDLTFAFGLGPSDVWAVGNDRAGLTMGPSATYVHFDGSVWSTVAAPSSPTIGALWGASSSNVWAVADGALVHWDGAKWTALTGSGDVDPFVGIIGLGIRGIGANDIWAVGESATIAHFDGSWHRVPAPASVAGNVYDVWPISPCDVWAVVQGPGTILHWDGASWSVVMSGLPDLYALWGLGPCDIWAVGSEILHY